MKIDALMEKYQIPSWDADLIDFDLMDDNRIDDILNGDAEMRFDLDLDGFDVDPD